MEYNGTQNLFNRKDYSESKIRNQEIDLSAIQSNELIEQLMHKQKQIDELKKWLRVLVEDCSDVVEIIDANGKIRYISESSRKVIGYKKEEAVGKNILDFFKGQEKEKIKEMVETALKNPSKTIQEDAVIISKMNFPIYLEVKMKNLLNEPYIEGIVVYLTNVTRRVEIEKRMAHISTHDPLTGLPNKIYFRKQLKIQCQHVQETKSRFALMMLEIDGLKYVNYSLGFEMGDKFILEIVSRLKGYLGESAFLSRYSEDHFAVIVPGTKTREEYEDIAGGLVNLFKTPITVDNYDLDTSVNIGICICPYDAQDEDSIRKQAKAALLRAKREGKNTYKFFSNDLNIQNYKEFVLRNDLHHAIEKNQMKIYYQPIVNLKTGEILAVEALLRWMHPEWGLVLPNEFIHLAEETGCIIDIGKWVIRQVCGNYKRWQDSGLPPIKVVVNVSGIQLMESGFANKIKSVIDEYGLNPKFLIIEIAEDVLLKNTDTTISNIETLRSFGIEIALNSFGLGFSSFTYQNRLKIDIIKLNGSFLKGIPYNKVNSVIVESAIHLAQGLKIKMGVEGIETWDQLTYLKYLNCYAGQGNIFGQGVELEEIEKILARRICKPLMVSEKKAMLDDQRRKLFRIDLPSPLESVLEVIEIDGKKVNVNSTKVLIKNIGPGGLCFVSNIKFPVKNDVVLQFTFQLLGQEIVVSGYIVWSKKEEEDNLYEYGIKFIMDESERASLIRILNQVQIKIRRNILFSEGSFVSVSYKTYFRNNQVRE